MKVAYKPSDTIIYKSKLAPFLQASIADKKLTIIENFLDCADALDWSCDSDRIHLLLKGLAVIDVATQINYQVKVTFLKHKIHFSIKCSNIQNPDYSIRFPSLSLCSEQNDQLIIPSSFGINVPLDREQSYSATYPSYHISTQFFLQIKSGLSLLFTGLSSPTSIKRYSVRNDSNNRLLNLIIEEYSTTSSETTIESTADLHMISGGLSESLEHYRSLLSDSDISNTYLIPAEHNATTHRLLPDIPLWINVTLHDLLNNHDPLIELRQRLGAPLGLVVYGWHMPQNDEMYPDYFPIKAPHDTVAHLLEELSSREIYTFPYINGRLCDDRSRFWCQHKDNRLSAVMTSDGALIREKYLNKHPAVVMCPSSSAWQDHLSNTAVQLSLAGFSGVYLDNFIAPYPHRCFSTRHRHNPGCTKAWLNGQNQTIAKMKQAVYIHNNSFKVISEDITDTSLNVPDAAILMAGAIISRWNKEINLQQQTPTPVIPALFGKDATFACRYVLPHDMANKHEFRITLAQQALSGCSIGGFDYKHLVLLLNPSASRTWFSNKWFLTRELFRHNAFSRDATCETHFKVDSSLRHSNLHYNIKLIRALLDPRGIFSIPKQSKAEFLNRIISLTNIIRQETTHQMIDYDILDCTHTVPINSRYHIEGVSAVNKPSVRKTVMSSLWRTRNGLLIGIVNISSQTEKSRLRVKIPPLNDSQTTKWTLNLNDSEDQRISTYSGSSSDIDIVIDLPGSSVLYATIKTNPQESSGSSNS